MTTTRANYMRPTRTQPHRVGNRSWPASWTFRCTACRVTFGKASTHQPGDDQCIEYLKKQAWDQERKTWSAEYDRDRVQMLLAGVLEVLADEVDEIVEARR